MSWDFMWPLVVLVAVERLYRAAMAALAHFKASATVEPSALLEAVEARIRAVEAAHEQTAKKLISLSNAVTLQRK